MVWGADLTFGFKAKKRFSVVTICNKFLRINKLRETKKQVRAGKPQKGSPSLQLGGWVTNKIYYRHSNNARRIATHITTFFSTTDSDIVSCILLV